MAGAQNKDSGLDALKPDGAHEPVVQDEVPAVDENEKVDDLSDDEVKDTEPEDVPAEPQPGDSTKATVAGNTNPKDFEIFDDRGNFVEKRDR